MTRDINNIITMMTLTMIFLLFTAPMEKRGNDMFFIRRIFYFSLLSSLNWSLFLNQSINQFSFIHDRNAIAALMFTNLSIIIQYNNVLSIYLSVCMSVCLPLSLPHALSVSWDDAARVPGPSFSCFVTGW